jgi:hypothetical protein
MTDWSKITIYILKIACFERDISVRGLKRKQQFIDKLSKWEAEQRASEDGKAQGDAHSNDTTSSKMSSKPMPFRFLSLPDELRRWVYSCLLRKSEIVQLCLSGRLHPCVNTVANKYSSLRNIDLVNLRRRISGMAPDLLRALRCMAIFPFYDSWTTESHLLHRMVQPKYASQTLNSDSREGVETLKRLAQTNKFLRKEVLTHLFQAIEVKSPEISSISLAWHFPLRSPSFGLHLRHLTLTEGFDAFCVPKKNPMDTWQMENERCEQRQLLELLKTFPNLTYLRFTSKEPHIHHCTGYPGPVQTGASKYRERELRQIQDVIKHSQLRVVVATAQASPSHLMASSLRRECLNGIIFTAIPPTREETERWTRQAGELVWEPISPKELMAVQEARREQKQQRKQEGKNAGEQEEQRAEEHEGEQEGN